MQVSTQHTGNIQPCGLNLKNNKQINIKQTNCSSTFWPTTIPMNMLEQQSSNQQLERLVCIMASQLVNLPPPP